MRVLPSMESSRIRSAIKRFATPKTDWIEATILGRRMAIRRSEWFDLYNNFEPETTKYFLENIQEGNTILDVGAHDGYYTLLFANAVGAEGRVYAFEPNPDVLQALQYNIQINNFSNVTIINKAVSDRNGIAEFYIPKTTEHGSIRPMEEFVDKIDVETIRLDDIELPYNFDFLKMDIEGHEAKALQGMTRLLARNKRAKLIIEFCPEGLRNDFPLFLELIKSYKQRGIGRNVLCWMEPD